MPTLLVSSAGNTETEVEGRYVVSQLTPFLPDRWRDQQLKEIVPG